MKTENKKSLCFRRTVALALSCISLRQKGACYLSFTQLPAITAVLPPEKGPYYLGFPRLPPFFEGGGGVGKKLGGQSDRQDRLRFMINRPFSKLSSSHWLKETSLAKLF